MTETEKLNLILLALHEDEEHSGEIVDLLKNKGVTVTLAEAQRLGRGLKDDGYIEFSEARGVAFAELVSKGFKFVEAILTAQKARLSTNNNYATSGEPVSKSANQSLKAVEEKRLKDVFVTYAWDKERPEHQVYVQRFVNRLRAEGFTAEMDLLLSQEEASIDFMKMMHRAMTDYKKVVIFLSAKYKTNAENFSGGVGTEYELIIKDIKEFPKKYILVSTYGLINDVIPLSFKNREVIEVSDPLQPEQFQRLVAKLTDSKQYHFEAVGERKAEVVAHRPIPLSLSYEPTQDEPLVDGILIKGIDVRPGNAYQFSGLYQWIYYDLRVNIQNVSSKPIFDFAIEVVLPAELYQQQRDSEDKGAEPRQDGDSYVFDFNVAKLSPGQNYSTPQIPIFISQTNAKALFKKEIKINVFTDTSPIQKEFSIEGLLWHHPNGNRIYLTVEDFQP